MGFQKAIASAVGTLVSFLLIHYGVEDVEGEIQVAVVTIVSALLTYLVPNSA